MSTAVAAAKLGLKCYLLLRHTESSLPEGEKSLDGNLLLSRLVGAEIKLFTIPQRDAAGGYDGLISELAKKLESEGKKPYCIPLGGSNALGTWGYMECMHEIDQQITSQGLKVDDIVVALGSGGSLLGLAIGNYLTGSKYKIHGVCASDNPQYFYNHLNEVLKEMNASFKAEDICSIIGGYVGLGYSKNTDDELKLLVDIAKDTGVILDSTYTLKAVKAVVEQERFTKRNVLYIHTGGLFNLYAIQSRFVNLVDQV
eukprot:TRINITY_DN6845_c0_g1_i1.p1 TRINITY_DN6845_c0_g1~~TRINITY_DN6845_c0_g1_i1.p1  ORF type:complete len:256 (-),score=37.63 TRINITY_DN6845_c0_g1_i1:2-769(-)